MYVHIYRKLYIKSRRCTPILSHTHTLSLPSSLLFSSPLFFVEGIGFIFHCSLGLITMASMFRSLSVVMVFTALLSAELSVQLTHPSDVQALMDVKAALDPSTIQPGSCVITWDFSLDPCDHLFSDEAFSCGINCEKEGEAAEKEGLLRITSVKLDSFGYGGSLSPSIGNLTFLQYLQVSGNNLSGPIPEAVSHLAQLSFLDLSHNAFSGSIPGPIFGSLTSLRSLNLAGNCLSGRWPPATDNTNNLSGLTELRLYSNSLSGSIPSDLRSFKELQILDLSTNAFYGDIPLHFPPMAISISLKNNRLSGEFSQAHVKGLSPLLNVLDLSGNNLSGPVDISLFKHPSLQQLNLSYNAFTDIADGSEDSTRSGKSGNSSVNTTTGADDGNANKSEMVAIDLSYNHISGRLPTIFASMERLASLSLSHNAFSGRIEPVYALKALAGIVGLEPLRRLMLDGNYLSGPLPPLFMRLLPNNIVASFVDNCLLNCPSRFFFCQGGTQKPDNICRIFDTKEEEEGV